MNKPMSSAMLMNLINSRWMIDPPALETIQALITRDAALAEMASLIKSRPAPESRTLQLRDGVAVIPVLGPIVKYADYFTMTCGGVTTEQLAADLGLAMRMSNVHSIQLVIDSPGGEASGISELAIYIREATKTKPVVAYVNQACSAAYYLAAAANEIVADDLAVVGSIGAVHSFRLNPDSQKLEIIEFVNRDSPMKRASPKSEEGAAMYQAIIDDMGAVFIRDVAAYRGVSPETVTDTYGRGGIMTAQQAIKVGMIDRIATQEQVFADMIAKKQPSYSVGGAKVMATTNPTTDAALQAQLVTSAVLEETAKPIAPAFNDALARQRAALNADTQIKLGAAVPAQRTGLVELYRMAALAEYAAPFTSARTMDDGAVVTSYADVVSWAVAQRPALDVTTELIPQTDTMALASPAGLTEQEKAVAAQTAATDRVAHLLSLTDLGRKASAK